MYHNDHIVDFIETLSTTKTVIARAIEVESMLKDKNHSVELDGEGIVFQWMGVYHKAIIVDEDFYHSYQSLKDRDTVYKENIRDAKEIIW